MSFAVSHIIGIVCWILLFNGEQCTAEIINTFGERNANLTANVSAVEDEYHNYHCLFKPGYRIPNRTKELECCKYARERYYRKWWSGTVYLTTFLDMLKQWKCPQLKKQCENRYFDFTAFTNIVYMRACHPGTYRSHCFETVYKLTSKSKKTHPGNVSDEAWRDMVYWLNSMVMTEEDIDDPCTQVALYEGGRGGLGRFHESVYTMVPFCGFVWCGYDADSVYERKISIWRCMPKGCRIGMGIAAAVIACLGISTIVANLLIIAVYWYKRRMNNSQVVYKVTLAIGDMLVGVVVFPTFISTFYMFYMTRQYMGDYTKPMRNETLDGVDLHPKREANGNYHSTFHQPYLNAVGFFTSLSIIISIYTLMVASFDRMAAICRPMAYDRSRALRAAKHVSAFLGFLGLFVATLPIYTRDLQYEVIASIFTALTGNYALILYSVIIILPLVLVWVSTLTLFIYSKKHTQVRRQISVSSKAQVSLVEKRLAKTLVIMVGVFTLSILPAVITLLLSFGLSDIHYRYPEKLNKTSATAYITTEFIVVVILTTNSLWNCLIYGSRDRDFGKTARKMFSTTSAKLRLSSVWRSMKSSTISKTRRLTATSITSAPYSYKSKGSAGSEELKNQIPCSTNSGNNEAGKCETGLQNSEDSTCRSDAIDSNAAKLHTSVMENLEKDESKTEDESKV